MPWALVSTDDFVSYTDHGVVLPSGGTEAADFDCYTGSVVDDGDRLHLFYTGHNPARRTAAGDLQVVCHATSDGDLTRWTKHPEHTFGAPTGYLPEDWRDPFVYRVSLRRALADAVGGAPRHRTGPPAWRGRPADLARSGHLADRGSAVGSAPLHHPGMPGPVPVERLVVSGLLGVLRQLPDPLPHRSQARTGPGWPRRGTRSTLAPATRRNRSPSDDRRFFVGWIATRSDERDDGDWEWAGDLAVLEAVQRSDGSLDFALPAELLASFPSTTAVHLVPTDGADHEPGRGAADRFSAWLGPQLPDPCLITVTLDIADGTQACGLLLRTDDDADHRLRAPAGAGS